MRNIFINKTKVENRDFIPSFFHIEQFPPENYEDDIDYRTQTFLERMRGENITSICLPISLTNNFFEFSGLTFAHHLRLSRDLDFCDVPIIFYGSLKLEQILRVTTLARVLLTANVHYVNIENYSLDKIAKSLDQLHIKDSNFSDFLNHIQLSPPENYDSHHSIDNEFSLIQWSKYIGCYNSLPTDFKKEFDSRLYFKYLNEINPIEESKESNPFLIKGKAKILLIDDEAEKGWSTFYESLFKLNTSLRFESLSVNYKRHSQDEIIKKALQKIKDFDADIVLLDLRLCDSDFVENTIPEYLTGVQILNKIKQKINKGIQVIITTASNKVWNHKTSLAEGADGYIIKSGNGDVQETLVEMRELLVQCIKRSIYLKNIDKSFKTIIELIEINEHIKVHDNKLYHKLITNLEIAYELLDLSFEIKGKTKYFSYSYLQLFLIIEELVNHESFSNGDEDIRVKCNEKEILVQQRVKSEINRSIKFSGGKYQIESNKFNSKYPLRVDTNFKVSSVLIYRFGNINSSVKKWTNIYLNRNSKAAHFDKNSGNIINEKDIIEILDFLIYFTDNSNISDLNINKGLKEKTFEEALGELKNDPRFKSNK